MRNIILGTVAGLLVGSAGALAYSQYFGDGGQLSDLKSQLDAANAKLADAISTEKLLREQNNSESDQLNQVLANKQPGASTGTDTSAAPAANPLTIGGMQVTPDMIRGFLSMMGGRGGPGRRSPQQRMFLLQSRLKLDPDQAKAIKAAMDADEKARRDAFRQAQQNQQPIDQAALAAASTLDKTLASVLSPTQQVQYQQVQSDEKQARAETAATQQVDSMMPLLQLTDDQKEKAMTALYQQQLSAPDAAAIATNPNPLGAISQQGQTIDSAMKGVLTPDQYAVYQQDQQVQSQALANFGGGRRSNNGGNGGGQGGNGGGAGGAGGNGGGQGQPFGSTASATTSTSTITPSSTTSTTTPASTTTGTTTDTSASTNTPSATTNAAASTPPAGN